jgi:hypothetical protein
MYHFRWLEKGFIHGQRENVSLKKFSVVIHRIRRYEMIVGDKKTIKIKIDLGAWLIEMLLCDEICGWEVRWS